MTDLSRMNAFIEKFGIIDLSVNYNSNGNEGYINKFKFTSSKQPTPSADKVMDELYDTLCDVSDWVNNEGGGGELVIEAGKVKSWTHYNYGTTTFNIIINYKAD